MKTQDGIKTFEDLVCWQKAMDLVVMVYDITRRFPSDERFGLVAQMRKAAVSIPSNIAEGQARNTRGEFLQFLGHARGSLAELQTQAMLAERLGIGEADDFGEVAKLIVRVSKLLTGLQSSLRTSDR